LATLHPYDLLFCHLLQNCRKLRLKAGNMGAHNLSRPLAISGFDGSNNVAVFLYGFS
jgi:hypothetical protein